MKNLSFVVRLAIALVIGLCTALAASSRAHAQDGGHNFYQLDVETAKRLHDLRLLVDDAERLSGMNRVDAAIRSGACAGPFRDLTESTEELRMLNRRKNSGDSRQRLSDDEVAWYNQQVDRRVAAVGEFDDCYGRQVDTTAADIYPPGVRTHGQAARYTKVLEKRYADFGLSDAALDQVLADAKAEIARIEEEPPFIGRITRTEGLVQIRGQGGWRRATPGEAVQVEEDVRTGNNGLAEIELLDYDPVTESGPTVLQLVPESQISLREFEYALQAERRSADAESYLTKTIRLIRGTIRTIARGWGSGSLFSVRAGTTVCGMRGTHVVMTYEPGLEETRVELVEGLADVTTDDGRTYTLAPGQSLLVSGDSVRYGGDLPQ